MRVAFCGEPGSGKTALSERVGIRLSFGQAVKEELAKTLLPILTDFEGVVLEDILADMMRPDRKDVYRHLLQVWGTEYRRAQDPDYWVRKMERLISQTPGDLDFAIDDCRFPNEYDMLRRLGFKFIRLQPGVTTRHMVGEEAAHESEQFWPLFNFDLDLPYLLLDYSADVVRMKFA